VGGFCVDEGRFGGGDGRTVVEGLPGVEDLGGEGLGEETGRDGLGLGVCGGREVVGLGDRVGLGGDVPPSVGVSTKLPSQ
jgi:hypothetical protein